MSSIFDKDVTLAKKCGEFFDVTSNVNLLFYEAVKHYMCCAMDEFDTYLEQIRKLEMRGDTIRRDAESHLYTEKLIPQSRGDVLGMIEATDDIIDEIKKTVLLFSVEMPEIPVGFRQEYLELAQICIKAVDDVLAALRVFFKNPRNVPELLDTVYAGEKAADKQAGRIKRLAFLDESLPLSHKMHLRYFTHHIDLIADKAEDLADRLAIAAIKQTSSD